MSDFVSDALPPRRRRKRKQTNEDRLKAMSTRELARELAAVAGYNGNIEEVEFWYNWLMQEVTEE